MRILTSSSTVIANPSRVILTAKSGNAISIIPTAVGAVRLLHPDKIGDHNDREVVRGALINCQLIFCLLILIALSACKKDYPASLDGDPVFYFKGIIDGSPVNLQAGSNNYYMYSSYVQDAKNVYNFLGDFKQTNCVNCPNSMQFQINDFKASASNAPALINTSLTPAYYSLQIPGGAPTKYPVIFISNPSKNDVAQAYLWDFGDGTTSSDVNPIHAYTHPGYYDVCLTITYASSCVSKICNPIKVGVPGADCSAEIVSQDTGNTISFLGVATGTAPFTYLWDFGDGSTSVSQNISHTYSTPGTYKVRLKVKDDNDYISDTYKYVSTSGFSGCFTNFKFYRDTINVVANPSAFSNVTIKWTDNAGTTYTSNDVSQTNDSYFRIVSTEDYLNNQNNQLTRKLRVNFKCKVFNGSNSHQIDNGDAIIAVSYK